MDFLDIKEAIKSQNSRWRDLILKTYKNLLVKIEEPILLDKIIERVSDINRSANADWLL